MIGCATKPNRSVRRPAHARVKATESFGYNAMRQLGITTLFLLILGSAAGSSTADAWVELEQFRFNSLDDRWTRSGSTGTREQRLIAAIARLNRQPRSQTFVEEAVAMLTDLKLGESDDDPGLWALYLLARIEQLYRVPTRPDLAAGIYRRLMMEYPRHPAGQRARAKLAVLLLYEPAIELSREAGFTAAEDLVVGCEDPVLRAELHLLLGRAAVFFKRGPAVVATHLSAALAYGIANPSLHQSALVALGTTARATGDRRLAIVSYRRFVTENGRDQRVGWITEQLRELETEIAAAEDGP